MKFKQGWYKTVTEDGRTVNSYGGLISNVHSEKGVTCFLVSSYWLKRLLDISNFSPTLYKLVYHIKSSNHIIFWFWLSRIPEEGTQVNYKTFNEMFSLNYTSARNLSKDFLTPIRKKLDSCNLRSFNFKVRGDLIDIIRYEVKTLAPVFAEEVKAKVQKHYTLSYYKKRHQLNDEQVKLISGTFKYDCAILEKAYKNWVASLRKKTKTTDYQGEIFLHNWQQFIIEEYKKTKAAVRIPNGYPRVI